MSGERGNFHTHCYLCDGAGAPIDYARVAVDRGLRGLGFTSHAPLPFPVDWVMDRSKLGEYASEIGRARSEFASRLPMFTGLEIDFITDALGPDPAYYPEIELDFVIGSVHFVRGRSDRYLGVDGPPDEFADALQVGFGGDIRALVGEYFANVRSMLESFKPDILGHIDVIRKNNGNNRYFDPSDTWYRDEVTQTIEAAAVNGCVVEVNTGGLARRKNVLYPEPWIAKSLVSKGVRMMVNTDAHDPDHLGFGYDRAFELLRDAGASEHWMLTQSGLKSFEL